MARWIVVRRLTRGNESKVGTEHKTRRLAEISARNLHGYDILAGKADKVNPYTVKRVEERK